MLPARLACCAFPSATTAAQPLPATLHHPMALGPSRRMTPPTPWSSPLRRVRLQTQALLRPLLVVSHRAGSSPRLKSWHNPFIRVCLSLLVSVSVWGGQGFLPEAVHLLLRGMSLSTFRFFSPPLPLVPCPALPCPALPAYSYLPTLSPRRAGQAGMSCKVRLPQIKTSRAEGAAWPTAVIDWARRRQHPLGRRGAPLDREPSDLHAMESMQITLCVLSVGLAGWTD